LAGRRLLASRSLRRRERPPSQRGLGVSGEAGRLRRQATAKDPRSGHPALGRARGLRGAYRRDVLGLGISDPCVGGEACARRAKVSFRESRRRISRRFLTAGTAPDRATPRGRSLATCRTNRTARRPALVDPRRAARLRLGRTPLALLDRAPVGVLALGPGDGQRLGAREAAAPGRPPTAPPPGVGLDGRLATVAGAAGAPQVVEGEEEVEAPPPRQAECVVTPSGPPSLSCGSAESKTRVASTS
jgi:hypothetical protein